MSNLTFLRKFVFRFVLGMAIFGAPRMLLAEQSAADAEEHGRGGSPSMASIKSAMNEFLSGVDITSCSSAVNTLSGQINDGSLTL